MEYRLLGPLEVSESGRVIELSALKERTLLAVLLLHPNETVSIDRLVDELWGARPPPTAAKVVATYVWQLRKALGDVIATRAPGYAAVVSPEQLDTGRFESLVARAQREQPAEAAGTLREALELWRGPALADLTFESSARDDVARLDDQRLSVVAQRIDHELVLGRHEDVLAELQELVAAHPFRERYRAQLMVALYRSGRQTEALETYRDGRRRLVDELGIEPGPELQRLERSILAQEPDLLPPATTAGDAGRPDTNLPRPASSFVGREHELREVLSRIEHGARLVTLTGPGGAGKTRLALEAANTLVPEYESGVFWVALAPLRDSSLVVETIRQTLETGDDLAGHIGGRRMLLLVDNLEHVIEAAPELASLVARCPRLTLLVTSREVLRVQGEVEYAVPPLAGDDAVSLFCQRAQVEPSEEIAGLCARLDNLPLAVELAAARAKALSPAHMLERLDERLDLFRGGRDADPRQQTLRATIAWSHDLVSEEEQSCFARLSAFAGGSTLESAEEVAEAELDTLQALVEKSLLRYTNGRYWMLETVREFAEERLAESGQRDLLMERLARHLVDLANEYGAPLFLERPAEAYAKLDLEHANVRAVVAWAAATERFERVAELLAVLHGVWTSRSHRVEVASWVELALRARGRVADELWPHVLLGGEQVLVLNVGDSARARALMEEALECLRRVDRQPFLEAMCLSELAGISRDEGRFEEAREWSERSLALRIEHGLPTARVSTDLGTLALTLGDLDGAERFLEDARADWQSLGLENNVASALRALAETARRRGDGARAAGLLGEAIRRFAELGDPGSAGECIKDLAVLVKERGDVERAAELWNAGVALARAGGSPSSAVTVFPQRIGELPERAQADVGEPDLERAVALALESVG